MYNMNRTKVVILGGGIGGIVTANHLAKILPQDVEIVLIEKNKNHSFAASYLWLIVSKRRTQQITSQLRGLIHKRVNILFEEIKQIDTQNKTITTEKSNVSFDYLVIALGATLDKTHFDKHYPNIHTFFTLKGSEDLNKALQSFKGGNVSIIVTSLPYKCPGAPYEGAMLINDFLSKKLGIPSRLGREKNNFTVNLYSPEPQPLPVAGPALGDSVKEILNNKGIGFHPLKQMTTINYDERKVEFTSGVSINYDLLILIPSHRAPEVITNSGLTDESGWIPVNKDTLETKYENVFAIGDITSITIPGKWQPDKPMKLPKAGVFAHSQAISVSKIIASKISSKESNEMFCADGFCMLEAGEDLAGFAYGDFYALPHPDVKMKQLGKFWHWGKILFEKWWLRPIGLKKELYQVTLKLGSRLLGIPVKF